MLLVLASSSRYRRSLLERLGVPFEAVAPPFDEEAAKTAMGHLDPEALSLALARGKALSVARDRPDAAVIGSDQIATIDGRKLDKPGNEENARAQLRVLAGRTHRLVTSVVVARGDAIHEHVDVHELTLRPLSDAQIARYVAHDAPFDCAGSYRAEALGVALFESVRREDATAVIGLPLVAVTRLLARLGLDPLG
jgi:septum formation protein